MKNLIEEFIRKIDLRIKLSINFKNVENSFYRYEFFY